MDITQDSIALMNAALAKASANLDVTKTITTANNLAAYDLQAPAKNLYPVFTPLRNSIPRVGGGKGLATNWRTVRNIIGSGYDTSAWVPEGQRSARMSYNTQTVAASYVTQGEEDNVTFEAVNAGRTFEDVRATMAFRLLQKTMLKEENAILGGNASLQLGVPSTPTLSASGSTGSTLPAATYSVIVVALTQEGYYNSSVSNGVATQQTLTGADGSTYTQKGGSSNQSANATQAVTLGQTLFATVAVVTGAVAYAWYVGTAGNEKLQQITTINSATFTAPLLSTTQVATAITADNSYNSLAYNGLLSAAFNPANGAYVYTCPTGGGGLTASGNGSIVEIDNALKAMWDNYQLSSTVIYANSQEIRNITKKVMTNSQGSLIRYNTGDGKQNEPFAVVAGGVVNSYFNPFMPEGGMLIPVKIHPKLPPGTVILWCERLPIYYQNNEVENVAEIKTRQDYYQIDWPVVSRSYSSGVYCETVLAIYAPFALGIITNIANL